MSSHKLNKVVGEYNKARSPASATPGERKGPPTNAAKQVSKKRGKELEFGESEGYTLNTFDLRKKGKKSEE